MNSEDVKRALREIASFASIHDDEKAHIREDKLYRDLLGAISRHTCNNPALCGALALESQNIEFARWYT